MYEQLEGEVEAGQSVLSKMPELIIAYEKLEEEKDVFFFLKLLIRDDQLRHFA